MSRRSLAQLTVAQTVGPLGDSMATLAVILHLQAGGGTGTTVAAVMFAEAVPPILSPIAGTIADRARDPRRLITVASLAQAAVLLVLAVALPTLGLLGVTALLFVRAAIDTAAFPAYNALIPAVVPPEGFARANTTIMAARELGMIAGPPIAGAIFAASGARLALLVDAATFVAVIPLVLTLPRTTVEHVPSTWRADIAEGISYIWRHPMLRAVTVGFWVLVFFAAPDDLVLVFLARDDFQATPLETGLLLTGAGVGLIAASPVLGLLGRRLPPALSTMFIGGVVGSIGNLLTAWSPVIAAAFVVQAVRGVGVAMFDAAGVRVLIQEEVPPRLLGRVFANVYGGVGVAAALGYVAAGPILDATSPRASFVVIGAGGLFAMAFSGRMVRRARGPSTTARPTATS